MVNYTNAIKRPFSDFTKLIVGALLSILPIINFFSLGYIFEASRLSMAGKKKLPAWKNWKKLFTRGFFFFLISLIWMIPFMIFISLGVSTTPSYSSIAAGASPYVMSPVFLTIGIILGILAWFLTPMALMGFIAEDRFLNGFNIAFISKQAFTAKYFINWLLATLIMLGFIAIGNLIMVVLSFIPIINIIIASIAYFAGAIVFYTLISETYSEI
ncbi:DUF4013 domain-containing protein [Candidatus Woesearchaeota archaeon]|nr:DUF4013 domain-containing protein [Candidatus Woesearchaeota archaeon]